MPYPDIINAMQGETPRQRFEKRMRDYSRKLRELRVQLGESLLRSRGIELPATDPDRDRIAQIEAIKDGIRSVTRELEEFRKFRDRAATRGMLNQVHFRQQMITGMEKKLERYNDELRRLQSIPGSFWAGST